MYTLSKKGIVEVEHNIIIIGRRFDCIFGNRKRSS